MNTEAVLMWIIIGSTVGLILNFILKGKGFGLVGNIIIGIIGSILGVRIGTYFGVIGDIQNETNPSNIVTAVIGALTMIFVLAAFKRVRTARQV